MNTNKEPIIDHLFRHQYGRMISIMTRIFGFEHLEYIEDAIQDTFISAIQKWRTQIPDNPEAWLTQAAKNRLIDIFRKLSADNKRTAQFSSGPAYSVLDNLFTDDQIQDSQLRMIFMVCHPALKPVDQIAFALKTISGFSIKEISSALLQKEETIKKRLARARKSIKDNKITFTFPNDEVLLDRLHRVHEILYLIFFEGFHSNHTKLLVRKELCGEALRLLKFILNQSELRSGGGYALFAMMCFHSARIESRVNAEMEVIDLEHQDRSLWYAPLVSLGSNALHRTVDYLDYSTYHIEAAIALEHHRAQSYKSTNWQKILELYQQLYDMQADELTLLSIAFIYLKLDEPARSIDLLDSIDQSTLGQREYLYYGVLAEYHRYQNDKENALKAIEIALTKVTNEMERAYIEKKRGKIVGLN